MKKIMQIFTSHPHSIGESYWQHAYFAALFGIRLLFAGSACFIHAIFPFLFKKTASNMLLKLISIFLKRMPAGNDKDYVISKLTSQ